MHSVNFVNLPAVHHPVRAHLASAAAAFFGGLEYDHDRAVEIAGFGQVFRSPQQHGGMSVMAAGVHGVRGFGSVVKAGLFVNRQRIHVGAQADDLAGRVRAAFDDTDDAGAADPCHHLVTAKIAQFFGDKGRSAVGFKQNLGVFVQVASPGGDFGQKFGEAVLDGHDGLRVCGNGPILSLTVRRGKGGRLILVFENQAASDATNRCMNAHPALNWSSVMYSSALWACAISPGPQTTVE